MTPDAPNRQPPALQPSPAPPDPVPGRDRRRAPFRRSGRSVSLLIALTLALVSTLGGVAYQLTPFDAADAPSPAEGVARVVSQGVSPFEDGEYAWRMVIYTARPRDEARAVSRPFGFVVAMAEADGGGPILLSNDDPDEEGDQLTAEARLAPGEVMIVPQGTDQQRASLTGAEVSYVAVELVPVDEVDDIGSGTLVFKTDAITVSAGQFDMDCVNALLRPGETTNIPDYGQPTLILATDGAIDVIPSGGRRRTLMPGEGDLFTGELTIEVNTDAASGGSANGKRLIGQDAPSGGAVFFAGVLGPDVPPADEPTEQPIQPASTEELVPPPTEAPLEPTATPESEPTDEPTEEPTEEPTPTEEPNPDDPDEDGLSNPVEERFGTDPEDFDTDDDQLGDGDEAGVYRTDPLDADSDDDELLDGEEVFVYATNPLNPDTDRDSCGDGFEVAEGFDPLDGQDCTTIT